MCVDMTVPVDVCKTFYQVLKSETDNEGQARKWIYLDLGLVQNVLDILILQLLGPYNMVDLSATTDDRRVDQNRTSCSDSDIHVSVAANASASACHRKGLSGILVDLSSSRPGRFVYKDLKDG